ncbi:hypothetical protein U9M48_033924 [Paspalum notatum var. saurae]|uniref:Cyclin n=1 Tax=Paspalum notatum var. saurae TaxID=547442 RepID=A0AAQ3U8J7_PASNO
MTAVALSADAGDRSPPPPPELAMVTRAVQRLVARNDAVAGPGGGGGGMAAFEAATAPRIGVAQYLERVHRYAALEPECYVVAYAYVDMAAHRRPAAAVASRNVHRLLLACLLLASKVLDDFHHSNAFFARVGGVSNAEMNRLELELLVVLDFAVAVDHRAYGRYREHLEKEMRRDYYSGQLPGPGGAPKPRTTAASISVVKTLPPLAEEPRPGEAGYDVGHGDGHDDRDTPGEGAVADGRRRDEHELGRGLPNGVVPAAANTTSLRELWAFGH